MARTVWAFEPLEELAGELGFISLDDEKLAEKLIKSGAVQDPYDPEVGPMGLKAMTSAPGAGYRTREIKAETGGKLSLPKGDKDPPKEDHHKDDEKKPGKGK